MNKEGPQKIETKKEILTMFIERFEKSRFECIDDLPPDRIPSDDPNLYKYKCRTNWWNGVLSGLSVLLSNLPDLSKETKEEVKNFSEYILSGVDYSKFRTKEEINKANKHLDNLIALLKKENI